MINNDLKYSAQWKMNSGNSALNLQQKPQLKQIHKTPTNPAFQLLVYKK